MITQAQLDAVRGLLRMYLHASTILLVPVTEGDNITLQVFITTLHERIVITFSENGNIITWNDQRSDTTIRV